MKKMIRIVFLWVSCLVAWQNLVAQTQDAPIYSATLRDVVITDTRRFKNDTDLYRYNQLKYYISTVLPYANEAIRLFYTIQQESNGLSKSERKAFIREQEKAIKENFEDHLKMLNITQGRILVKLINRQLKTPCYDIVKELKNPVSAAYYQSWGKLNGIHLNKPYRKDEEPDMEQILRQMGY
jgi:hypothetical protein